MLFTTNSAEEFLSINQIEPQIWQIPQEVRAKITNEKIGVAVFNAPASVLDLSVSPLPADLKHLIIIDKGPLKARKITADQQIAMLLHEIGHIVAPPPPKPNSPTGQRNIACYLEALAKKPSDDEVCADQFASHCGYAEHLAEALAAMLRLGVPGFDEGITKKRIELLRADQL